MNFNVNQPILVSKPSEIPTHVAPPLTPLEVLSRHVNVITKNIYQKTPEKLIKEEPGSVQPEHYAYSLMGSFLPERNVPSRRMKIKLLPSSENEERYAELKEAKKNAVSLLHSQFTNQQKKIIAGKLFDCLTKKKLDNLLERFGINENSEAYKKNAEGIKAGISSLSSSNTVNKADIEELKKNLHSLTEKHPLSEKAQNALNEFFENLENKELGDIKYEGVVFLKLDNKQLNGWLFKLSLINMNFNDLKSLSGNDKNVLSRFFPQVINLLKQKTTQQTIGDIEQLPLVELLAECLVDNEKVVEATIKEQKLHAFARFDRLVSQYESFVNDAQSIHEYLSQNVSMQAGELFHSLLTSMIEDASKEAKNESSNKSKGYRRIMGRERKDLRVHDSETKQKAASVYGKKQKWARAHTLPFPGVFSWNEQVLIERIQEKVGEFSPHQQSFKLSKEELFKQILEAEGFAGTIKAKLEENLENGCKDAEIVFHALGFLSEYYLRVFSETENFPQFINELDQVSEWISSNVNDKEQSTVYKKELSKVLVELLQAREKVSYSTCAQALDNYFSLSQLEAENRLANLDWSNPRLASIQTICLYQIQQAMLVKHTKSLTTIKKLAA